MMMPSVLLASSAAAPAANAAAPAANAACCENNDPSIQRGLGLKLGARWRGEYSTLTIINSWKNEY